MSDLLALTTTGALKYKTLGVSCMHGVVVLYWWEGLLDPAQCSLAVGQDRYDILLQENYA